MHCSCAVEDEWSPSAQFVAKRICFAAMMPLIRLLIPFTPHIITDIDENRSTNKGYSLNILQNS